MNLRNLIEKLKNKIFNNKGLLFFSVVAIILTIFLDHLVFLVLNIFSCSSISGVATISDRILFLTFLALVWYAWEANRMKNEMVTQTELGLKPIFMMYIRNIRDYANYDGDAESFKRLELFKNKYREYLIPRKNDISDYFLRLRNVGKGPAFNVRVKDEKEIFKVEKYQSQFFAPEPKGDEQSIKIVKENSEEINNYDEFKNIIFEIICKNVNGKEYKFRYKIIDIEKQEIRYLG